MSENRQVIDINPEDIIATGHLSFLQAIIFEDRLISIEDTLKHILLLNCKKQTLRKHLLRHHDMDSNVIGKSPY